MKKREIVVLIDVVIVLTSVSLFTPLGYYPGLSISMGIGGGWSLSGYVLEIDGYGNVTYETFCPPTRCTPDKRSGKITPWQIQEIVAAVKKANVWAMEDRAGGPYILGGYLFGGNICSDCQQVGLSITLNGQSNHISYFVGNCDGSMGRPAMLSPAQALCDLQHKIEAIGRSAIPAAVLWPAPPHAP